MNNAFGLFFIYRALYGYEPHSNDLRVVSTGDGGLEELNEDLNTSNIMYAFVRIQDSKTSLTKYVLINWQVIKTTNDVCVIDSWV